MREQEKKISAKTAAPAAVLLMGAWHEPRDTPPFLIEFVTEIFAFCFDFFCPASSIIIDK